ncbi:fimbrial protein [Dyella koreensis]|uniref:Type 1 fimbrial protein n=1 Tax=Dyella koreensis TaxID=311235 RepID=A0ABW8K7U5_9GAMM
MTIRFPLKWLALGGALALLSANAAAADLTVRFTGRFLASTCAFSIADVDLGSYSATTFTGSTTTPSRNIVVRASSCTPDITTVHMRFTGTADATVTSYFAARSVTGNVTGVGIELMNGSSQRVTPNVTTFDWPFATWGMTYNLYARFAQTRPSVTAGTVSTPITIQFTYN